MHNERVEIVLVEDNPDDIEIALLALKKMNLANSIKVIEDGAAAIDYLIDQEHNFPRLVLLDLKLPKVDGLEVLRRIRENERTRAMPVVVLTSSSEEKDLVESYRLGVNSYIVKPVDFKEFSRAVCDLGYYWMVLNIVPPQS